MLDPSNAERTNLRGNDVETHDVADAAEKSQTSLSLLAKLKGETSGASWDEFVRRYQPRIMSWCRRWGLQECDAQDVSQNVMLELAKQMHTFEYQPGGKFRAWLKTIARRAWYDYTLRRRRIEYQAPESDLWRKLDNSDAEKDLLDALEEECNRELLSVAMRIVESKVKPETWQAFKQTELDGQAADEVAGVLGIARANVYVARGRIQKMIVAEVKRLDAMG
ncbi:MAG: sigma-70 family RNA polymerase sigma factor [Aureliella sp.]